MTLGDACGWLGFGCSVIINVPQIFKIYRSKVVDGISIQTYILIFLTCLFYAIPAVQTEMWHFVLTNVIGMITSAMVIVMVHQYGHK